MPYRTTARYVIWRLSALVLFGVCAGTENAEAFTRKIYDASNPDGTGAWSQYDPSIPGYPMQYAPYVFGRREGQPPRGPNPVPGVTFGSLDVDIAYDLVGGLHQYYLEKFGRNGPNRQGGLGNSTSGVSSPTSSPLDEYRLFVNYNGTNPITCESGSAFFDASSGPSLRFCCGNVTADIVAHEMHHAVMHYETSSNPFGENGALEESMGDFFGVGFEVYLTAASDWLVVINGNEVAVNLADPPSETYLASGLHVPYPDRYLSPNFYTGSGDQGGVHLNSTVLSKAAYLAVEGGSFNGFDIAGIGIEKVEQIWYRTATTYFTGSETFNSAYTDLIQAANDLYGPADVWELTKALRAVEMNMSRSFVGNLDGDGDVDGNDFLTWQRGLGSDYSQSLLGIWQTHFGESAAGQTVPEPSTAAMLVAVLLSLSLRRRIYSGQEFSK